MSIIDKIIQSFEHGKMGFSSRKLTAFSINILVIVMHIKWLVSSKANGDFSLMPEILIIDYSFILALFGLIVWQNKNEKSSPPPPAE